MSITKANSWRPIVVWITGFTCIMVLAFLVFDPCRSIIWHCRNGSQIHFAKAEITLPIFWWKQDGLDEGAISIKRAGIGRTDDSSLRIFPLAHEKTKADDKAAFDWQQGMLGSVSPKERKTFLPVEIHAQSVLIYCVKDIRTSKNNFLICRAPGISWGFWFNGPVGDEGQAESVLSTLQISK